MHDNTRRVRIGLNAMLYSSELSYRSAGVSHYIGGLLGALPRSDSSADYVAFHYLPQISADGWEFVHARAAGGQPWRRILWEQFGQPAALRRSQVDLVHAPVYVGPLAASCPVVVTIHDLSHFIFPELFQPAKRVYLQTMTRITAKRAAAVICDSENTRRDVLRLLQVPPERAHTVLIGVDAEMQPLARERVERFRAERRLPERYILTVSTLEPRKNIPALIEAYCMLCRGGQPVPHLVIGGGKGWYFRAIEQQVERLGLRDHVVFTGFIPQQELPLWYNASEIFVYPSLYEGFGMPPLEAMACGVPVITSDKASLPEVVGDGGLMVDTSKPELLATALQRLLDEPETRIELGQRGQARARLFSWEKTARETASIYHAVLG